MSSNENEDPEKKRKEAEMNLEGSEGGEASR